MGIIRFTTVPFKIGRSDILLLPKEASAKLPSRGMVMVRGTVNGAPFRTPLEPDGRGSHWLRATKDMAVTAGAAVDMTVESSKDWPEPEVPADLKKALTGDPEAHAVWDDITPMARWDWLRWIASTAKSETRSKRIGAALSKLKAGTRRPCCFNRTLCTDLTVSSKGALLEPGTV